MKIIHTKLLHRLHNWEFDIFDREIRIQVQNIVHKQYINQRHKLNRLIQQNQATDQQVIKPPQQSRVTNLTSVNFTQQKLNILNKGLKYSTFQETTRRISHRHGNNFEEYPTSNREKISTTRL